jgi:arabinose-5-phosphate isomerase
VYTDGDLRRTLEHDIDVRSAKITEVMTRGGKTAKADWLAAQAVQLMEKHKITALLVVDETGKLVGAIHMQDLLRAGVV